MPVSRAMRRLLGVLEMQEEQSRAALESAVADLRRIEKALDAAAARERGGRLLVAASAASGEFVDRLAGLEEALLAHCQRSALKPRIAETERSVIERRREFLKKRIERRQAETLIERTEAEDAIATARRMQREVDDQFLSQAVAAGTQKKRLAKLQMGTASISGDRGDAGKL
jgi:aspartokinase